MKRERDKIKKIVLEIFNKALERERETIKEEIQWINKVIEFYSKRKQFLEQVLTMKREVLLEIAKREFEKNK